MADVATRTRVKNLETEKEGEFVPFDVDQWPGYNVHMLLKEVPETMFLCQINRIDPSKKKVHSHGGENFLVILEGEGRYYTDWDKSEPVKAGDFCHALPFEPHGIECTGSKQIKYLAIEGPRESLTNYTDGK